MSVPAAQEAAALAIVRRYAEPAAIEHANGAAIIVLANPEGLQADQHPYSRAMLRALRSEGVTLRSAVL